MNILTLLHNVLLSLCRIDSSDAAVLKVIGRSLSNLEELFLDHLENDSSGTISIKYLVKGCPKLKILHVGILATLESIQIRTAALESVQHELLGLSNLIEFRHLLVVFALEKIIQDDRADKVSSLRTLYINDAPCDPFGVTDVYKSGQVVMNQLINITKLHITVSTDEPCEESLSNFSLTVSTMSQLTELTWQESFYRNSDTIVRILGSIGHLLRSLYLCGETYFCLDVIDQCRNLRVLSIANIRQHQCNTNDPSYGCHLHEQFTPFHHLQELYLSRINSSHFKPALLKSLIASPVLQDLKLESLSIFTDHIVEAAVTHINEEGEQLAFTSLRKLEIKCCDPITNQALTNYLENVVSQERVPLEMLTIERCSASDVARPGAEGGICPRAPPGGGRQNHAKKMNKNFK